MVLLGVTFIVYENKMGHFELIDGDFEKNTPIFLCLLGTKRKFFPRTTRRIYQSKENLIVKANA